MQIFELILILYFKKKIDRITPQTGNCAETGVRLGRPSVECQFGVAQCVFDVVAIDGLDDGPGRSFGHVGQPIGSAVAVERLGRLVWPSRLLLHAVSVAVAVDGGHFGHVARRGRRQRFVDVDLSHGHARRSFTFLIRFLVLLLFPTVRFAGRSGRPLGKDGLSGGHFDRL